ncbi:cytochrome o ubiquinol oxidase subunit IV [Bartonella taylorii]|uniref:Cytochrome bo(3) ubiquinol oxidase subunit 4 n=1 Tax=Bartonella taylorii TaxID=33046 RepID=A0A9Q9DM68_BARTA|nr:cytochrome o ubiquinol oxidase subunit IV [Bartonella taylorii]USP02576.1 cytochrome o ubiquinol oxidase subunit IV [Bartonella taylorii]
MSMHNETHSPSTGSYLVGFILAVFFTLGSFIPVMYGMMESWAISTKVAYLIGMAIIQIIVQIVFFLHLNSGPDAKWNLSALWFAVICVFIIIGGTWWAISHLNYNMMGGSGRIIEPEKVEGDSSVSVEKLSDIQKLEEHLLGVQVSPRQAPNMQAPVEQAPGVEMPVGQAPNMQVPVEQAPGVEMPVGQAPNTQAPVEQAPGVEMPVGQAPNTQAPVEQAPGVEMPVGQAPNMQAPVEQAPGVEMPVGQAPNTQAPVEQAPGVEMPVGQVPNTQAPIK